MQRGHANTHRTPHTQSNRVQTPNHIYNMLLAQLHAANAANQGLRPIHKYIGRYTPTLAP